MVNVRSVGGSLDILAAVLLAMGNGEKADDPHAARRRDGEATRGQIVRVVTEDPGIHKSELCRTLRLAWGTISHHLHVLEKKGLVQSVTSGRNVHVFPPDVPSQHLPWLAMVRDDAGALIVEALAERPEAQVTDLTGRLGLSRKVVRRHLLALDEAGLVVRDGRHRAHYRIEEEALVEIHRFLAAESAGRASSPQT